MKAFMKELRKKVTVALVSGSDFPKVQEQMGNENGKMNPNLTLTVTSEFAHKQTRPQQTRPHRKWLRSNTQNV